MLVEPLSVGFRVQGSIQGLFLAAERKIGMKMLISQTPLRMKWSLPKPVQNLVHHPTNHLFPHATAYCNSHDIIEESYNASSRAFVQTTQRSAT